MQRGALRRHRGRMSSTLVLAPSDRQPERDRATNAVETLQACSGRLKQLRVRRRLRGRPPLNVRVVGLRELAQVLALLHEPLAAEGERFVVKPVGLVGRQRGEHGAHRVLRLPAPLGLGGQQPQRRCRDLGLKRLPEAHRLLLGEPELNQSAQVRRCEAGDALRDLFSGARVAGAGEQAGGVLRDGPGLVQFVGRVHPLSMEAGTCSALGLCAPRVQVRPLRLAAACHAFDAAARRRAAAQAAAWSRR